MASKSRSRAAHPLCPSHPLAPLYIRHIRIEPRPGPRAEADEPLRTHPDAGEGRDRTVGVLSAGHGVRGMACAYHVHEGGLGGRAVREAAAVARDGDVSHGGARPAAVGQRSGQSVDDVLREDGARDGEPGAGRAMCVREAVLCKGRTGGGENRVSGSGGLVRWDKSYTRGSSSRMRRCHQGCVRGRSSRIEVTVGGLAPEERERHRAWSGDGAVRMSPCRLSISVLERGREREREGAVWFSDVCGRVNRTTSDRH